MDFRMRIYGLCSLLAIMYPKSNAEVFVSRPLSTAVALNTTATFICQATGVDSLDWLVDGRAASHRDIFESGFTYLTTWENGFLQSVLSVVASSANNGTTVECEAFSYHHGAGAEISPPATLIVQGLLSTPGDFRVKPQDRQTILLEWKLPFTLAGVPITSINLYYSENSECDSEHQISIKLPGSSTSYDFQLDVSNPDPCVTYALQVSATNEVGESERSEIIEGNFLTDPAPVNTDDVQVAVLFTQVNITTVTFSFPDLQCPGKAADSYTVNMTCSSVVFSELKPNVSIKNNFTVVEIVATSDVLLHNNLYRTIITSVNQMGSVESNGTIDTSTFDVQDAQVLLANGSLCVSCDFANGSTAKGCVAVLPELGYTLTAMKHANGDNFTANNCTKFSASGGNYEVFVYDLEVDETQSIDPAISKTISVPEAEQEHEASSSYTSTEAALAISAGGFTFCVIIAVLVAAAILLKRRQKRSKGGYDASEERVYDTIPDPPKKQEDAPEIIVKKNSAYECVRSGRL